MDKAYIDYLLFGQWTSEGIFFVTWMKENAVYEVVENRHLARRKNILRDDKTKPENQVICSNKRKCSVDSDLDSSENKCI